MDKQEVVEKLKRGEIQIYNDISNYNEDLFEILKDTYSFNIGVINYISLDKFYYKYGDSSWECSSHKRNLPIINLSDIEMKKYTIKEAYEKKYSIWCTTVEQANIINKATGSENEWKIDNRDEPFEVFIISWKSGNVFNCSWQTDYNREYFVKQGTHDNKFATKCIDFSELKLENEMEEIIGYNYKPEFEQAITKLLIAKQCDWDIANLKINLKEKGFNFKISDNSGSYTSYFKSLNLLDTFFTPVYALQYKIGDWVKIKDECNLTDVRKLGYIVKITSFHEITEGGEKYIRVEGGIGGLFIKDIERLATQDEINSLKQTVLELGDKKILIVIKKNSIKADNTEWYIQKLEDIYKTMKPKTRYFDEKYQVSYESVKIGCVTFGMNEIKQIIDEYYKLTNG